MIKNSHHLSFRNSQNGFSNWVSLMIYLFCKQYHTFVIILKMFFQKLSFIVKIVFVTLCSVRKMDVSLLCFKTFFGALYIQAITCALDVHLHIKCFWSYGPMIYWMVFMNVTVHWLPINCGHTWCYRLVQHTNMMSYVQHSKKTACKWQRYHEKKE